jgi:radical SAM family uncharacterized protein/radical SAM-linked protein
LKNIKDNITKDLLPFIIKPGRFIGNEPGAICHPFENRVSIALSYPDLYDLGMSNLGLQILYHIINKSSNGRAERVFAVPEDAAAIMREKNIPLFSLESKTPLKNFDLLGFNSATELNYTNILDMLDLAGIPLQANDRSEDDPLIAVGGGCAFNPEPLADFADFFFLGDAEEGILEIIDCLGQNKDSSREDKLLELSKIQGVYVPSFYRPEYNDAGKFLLLKKLQPDVSLKIKARIVKEIKSEYYPIQPVVPLIEAVHDRLAVEIMRGCGHACRFCQATVLYKPARARKVDDILRQVQTSLEKTGYDEVTLLSLSSGDYKEIEDLVRRLAVKLKNKHIAISLPSLRITTLSLELADLITSNQKSGLTFAPEAGTERLRKVINKPLNEETLFEVLSEAFSKGWQTIKLYFMIGLPTESKEDLQGIADILNKLVRISDKYRGKRSFNITISTFCPKSHTSWQWERQISIEETEQKRDFLRKAVRNRNIRLKFHDPAVTWLEGVMGRGDRRLGKVIQKAYRLGARMDGWKETFDLSVWQKAFEEENLNPNIYLAERSTGDKFPWDHIEKGLSKESLLKDLAKSRGLLDIVKSLDKEEVETEVKAPQKKKEVKPTITYGRAPKTIKASADATVPQSRLRIQWGRSGLMRFLSHLDNMRVLERTFRRANLPISFSQGFRPHPKFSFGPPLTLGFTSEAEYIDIQLETPIQQYMVNSLTREFPSDFRLIGTKVVLGKTSSLASKLNLSVYQVELPSPLEVVKEMTQNILDKKEFTLIRETKTGPVNVELRNAIIDLECKENESGKTILTMKTGMADLPYIKPLELLEHGYGLSGEDLMALPVHRKAMYRICDDKLIDPFDII